MDMKSHSPYILKIMEAIPYFASHCIYKWLIVSYSMLSEMMTYMPQGRIKFIKRGIFCDLKPDFFILSFLAIIWCINIIVMYTYH